MSANWLSFSLLIWVMVLSFPFPNDAVTNMIRILNDCACPEHSLQITCSVVGPGSTVWQGSTFNCPSLENEISLRHSRFTMDNTIRECNGITAQGLNVSEQNCFLSQLTLIPRSSTNGQTVTCIHDNGSTSMNVGTVMVNLTTEPFRAPTSVRLTGVNNQPRELTFTWDTVESSCPSLQYRVNATGCGTCTTTSTSNTATCTNYDITVDQLCTFAVQTVICDDIVSVMNASIQVPLKVPDKPSSTKIVPSYSFENGSLLRLNTSFSENSSNFYISDEIEGSNTSYNLTYTNQDGVSCNSVTIPTISGLCRNGICQYIFNISSSTTCIPSNSVEVSLQLTATNVFGVGPTLDITNIDAINSFVDVQFDEGSSKIVCMFSESENISVNMLCTIEYAQEGSTDVVTKTNQSEGQAAEDRRRIEINLSGLSQSTTYTFDVTATNGTTTVNVEGSFTTSGGGNSLGSVAIAGIIISIIIISILLSVSAVIIVFVIIRKKHH